MLTNIDGFHAPRNVTTGMIDCGERLSLRYALWFPESEALGTVCIFQGRAEFIEKYYEVVGELLARGFAVATMDWRGQGLSSRQIRHHGKGHVDSFRDYEDDVDAFLQAVVLPDCPPPYFALAHSMGAHVLLRYSRHGANAFDRMVLSAPMIDINFGVLTSPVVNALTECMGLFGLGSVAIGSVTGTLRFDNNKLTRDRYRFDRMQALATANPELVVTAPTAGWLQAATDSIAFIKEPAFAASVSVPVLMIAGAAERLVSFRAIEEMGRRLKAGRTLVLPGARHEILMETDPVRDRFWAAFDAFIPGEAGAHGRRLAIC